MFLEITMLIAGIFILVKSSEAAVKSSVVLAKTLGISEVFIGFALLAFATSLPEFAITIVSIINGQAIIGMSTLIGSSISDIALIFGIMGIAASFAVSKNYIDEIAEILLLACILGGFVFVLGTANAVFGVFAICVFYLFSRKMAKENMHINGIKEKELPTIMALKHIVKIILIAGVIVISAQLVAISAVSITSNYGIMESFIGAAIIGLGSSLPEMAVSMQAIRKKNVGLAVGNALGSLMVNLGFILGIASIFSPIAVDLGAKAAIAFMIAASAVLYMMLRNGKFGAVKAIVMLAVYAIFWITMFVVGVL